MAILIDNNFYNFSEDPKDLIRKCLVVDPVKRITVGEVLQHPFFNTVVSSEKIKTNVYIFQFIIIIIGDCYLVIIIIIIFIPLFQVTHTLLPCYLSIHIFYQVSRDEHILSTLTYISFHFSFIIFLFILSFSFSKQILDR